MQLLIFILAYPVLWLISRLPFRLLYLFSDFVFFLVYRIIGYRKKIVLENLKLVFPEKSEVEIKSIHKNFFKHMCDMFLEMIKTMSISTAEINKRYKIKNMAAVREIENEKSILVLFTHYANWEWSVSVNNHIKLKGYAVYQKITNPYFDKLVKRIRTSWNNTPISQKDTVKTIIRNEQDGIKGMYGMISDQSPQRHRAQYWGDFMGITVPVFNGAETIARKLDLAVFFLKVSKIKRGYYEAEFIPISSAAKQTEKNEITERFLQLSEEQINQNPSYYLWTHRRWKHRNKVPEAFQKSKTS